MLLPRFNFPEETFLRIGHKVSKTYSCENLFFENIYNTVKPLNSRRLQVFKNLSGIEMSPLVGGNLKRLTFGTNCFVCYSGHVHYERFHCIHNRYS